MTDLEKELIEIICGIHWMARRYVSGRSTYAVLSLNQHTSALIRLGIQLPEADGTVWALDGMGRLYDGLTNEQAEEARLADDRAMDRPSEAT